MSTAEHTRGHRKTRTGKVVSDKMDKTIVVDVERRISHPLYGKIMRMKKRLYVHDEENKAVLGDKVTVMESRPLSRKKRWRLVDVIK